jgi:hypothetical protein
VTSELCLQLRLGHGDYKGVFSITLGPMPLYFKYHSKLQQRKSQVRVSKVGNNLATNWVFQGNLYFHEGSRTYRPAKIYMI